MSRAAGRGAARRDQPVDQVRQGHRRAQRQTQQQHRAEHPQAGLVQPEHRSDGGGRPDSGEPRQWPAGPRVAQQEHAGTAMPRVPGPTGRGPRTATAPYRRRARAHAFDQQKSSFLDARNRPRSGPSAQNPNPYGGQHPYETVAWADAAARDRSRILTDMTWRTRRTLVRRALAAPGYGAALCGLSLLAGAARRRAGRRVASVVWAVFVPTALLAVSGPWPAGRAASPGVRPASRSPPRTGRPRRSAPAWTGGCAA